MFTDRLVTRAKTWEKICIAPNHFAIHLKQTPDCKSTTLQIFKGTVRNFCSLFLKKGSITYIENMQTISSLLGES